MYEACVSEAMMMSDLMCHCVIMTYDYIMLFWSLFTATCTCDITVCVCVCVWLWKSCDL